MKLPKLTPASARAAIIGLGFILVLIILAMLAFLPHLSENDTFKMIAQAVIIQGFFGLIVAFYFTATEEKSEHIHHEENDDENLE